MTKIIKRSTEEIESSPLAPSVPGKIIDREVIAATEESRRIVEAAQVQAQQLLDTAQRDHDAAVGRGLAEGREAGLAEWHAQVQSLRDEMKDTLEKAKPQIIKLALRIAEKIVRQKMEMTPETMLPMIDEALRSLRAQSKIILRVNSADQDLLRSRCQRWKEKNPSIGEIDVIGEDAMSRGGCVIETEFGTVNATVETQIKVMERHLLGDVVRGGG